MEITIQDMMDARERRAAKQKALLDRYRHTLLCFTMNIAGPEKDNALIHQGMDIGHALLGQSFLRLGIEPIFQKFDAARTGCERFYVLPLAPEEAKRMGTDIEEASPLGRLFDMDVIRPDGTKVERQEIGLPGRRCLICGGEVWLCARARAHSAAELRGKTDEILRAAIRRARREQIARLACQALLAEANTTPKPGLVDRENNGSHRDMDIFTFAASSAALWPYFARCAAIGLDTAKQPPLETFEKLRIQGRIAEGEMLAATGGVNTHKGAIFSVGLVCAAAGRLEPSLWRRDDILLGECTAMTAGLTERDFAGLTQENAKTAGQRLYLQHGISGVRGEAERGFPLVRLVGLPRLEAALEAGLSLNDAGCAALIALMAQNVDTNIIHRSGLETQRRVAAQAGAMLRETPYPDRRALKQFDRGLIEANISPGGSADLLALCYLLHFLKEAV